jgi:hypothetical protein
MMTWLSLSSLFFACSIATRQRTNAIRRWRRRASLPAHHKLPNRPVRGWYLAHDGLGLEGSKLVGLAPPLYPPRPTDAWVGLKAGCTQQLMQTHCAVLPAPCLAREYNGSLACGGCFGGHREHIDSSQTNPDMHTLIDCLLPTLARSHQADRRFRATLQMILSQRRNVDEGARGGPKGPALLHQACKACR